jgi:hypothetical protein
LCEIKDDRFLRNLRESWEYASSPGLLQKCSPYGAVINLLAFPFIIAQLDIIIRNVEFTGRAWAGGWSCRAVVEKRQPDRLAGRNVTIRYAHRSAMDLVSPSAFDVGQRAYAFVQASPCVVHECIACRYGTERRLVRGYGAPSLGFRAWEWPRPQRRAHIRWILSLGGAKPRRNPVAVFSSRAVTLRCSVASF